MTIREDRRALEVVFGWLEAMRRGDLDDVANWLDPEVEWRGLPKGESCLNRVEVLDMLRDRQQQGLPAAAAFELVAAGETVVLGVKAGELQEIGGVNVDGQLFNVFRVRCGVIVEVDDFRRRADALNAAGAPAPGWA